MRRIPIVNMSKIKKAVPILENKMKIKISVGKNSVELRGSEFDEFVVDKMIRAVDFGFHIDDALLLKREEFVLEFINIGEHTRRKNLKEVRARLIGREGKARKTIQTLTGSAIVVQEGSVGVIVDAEHLDATMQSIESLIQGAKHGNVFAYLEKQNVQRNKFDNDDLGLRESFLKKK